MKLFKQIAATTALLVSLGFAAGCTPQRRPLPPTPGNPPSVTQPNQNNTGTQGRNNLARYNRNNQNFMNQFGANQNQVGGTDQLNRNRYGTNQGGMNQGGTNQRGMNQGGMNQGGANQGRTNQGTTDQGTTNQRMLGMSSLSRTNNAATNIAKRISRNPNIDNATVVILGRTAYIALDLKNNVNSGRATTVKKSVSTLAKRSGPAVNSVVVLTDPDSFTRLRRIAQGIATGTPIRTFTRELSDIGRRITPNVR
jgi:YhcN/YlaJ family sporulation lipoprotein